MKFAELTQVALLGTERQNLDIPAAATRLGQLASQLHVNQRERAFLSLAALHGLHERIGSLPIRDSAPMPVVCAVEQLPRTSECAGSLLKRLLSGDFAELLPEWLRLATGVGLLATPETLPDLLNTGAAKPEWREAILPVLGERGRWLAAQNPDWAWVVGAGAEDENLWHTGERTARMMFLRRMRRANPARARELMTETWKEETPDDRAAFVALLEIGLAPEDESFLEAALDDKRKEVRRTAAALLTRLPESAVVGRMVGRVKPLLKFVPGEAGSVLRLKKAKPAALVVTLPVECDKAMQRDGIELKPAPGMGEKAWWLIQMLEATPLDLWLREWNTTIEDILSASQQGEWKKELFEGWARAAIRQRNAAWAEALMEMALEAKRFDKFEGLLAAMPPARREGQLTTLLEQNDPKVRELQGGLLMQCRHDWSPAFSQVVLALMRRVTAQETGDWQLRNQFKSFAPQLAPEKLAGAAAGWPTDAKAWEFWSKGVDEFLAVVQFRADLHASLISNNQ